MIWLVVLLQLCFLSNCSAQDDAQIVVHLLQAQKYGDVRTYIAATNALQTLMPKLALPADMEQNSVTYYGMIVIKTIPVIIWQLLFLICWYLFCFLLIKNRRKSFIKKSLFGILLILLMPIMIGYYTDKQKALVTAETQVYNGPNNSLYKVGSVDRYALVTVLDTKKEWYKISHDATIGWVEQSTLAII